MAPNLTSSLMLWTEIGCMLIARIKQNLLMICKPRNNLSPEHLASKLIPHTNTTTYSLKGSLTKWTSYFAGAVCGPPCLFVSTTTDLIKIDPVTSASQPIISGLELAVAVDVHFDLGLVFWSDFKNKTLSRANIDGSNVSTIIHNNGSCAGLAVEWMSNLLYWTDERSHVIEVSNLNGSNRRTLFSLGLDKPRGIALDPHSGWDIRTTTVCFKENFTEIK